MTHRTIGLTTGQAARYCLVSPDTMVNWIKANNLPAQRTVGGQYRILVEDLRRFMIRNHMSTAQLDTELECRPYCWQARHDGCAQGETPPPPCDECPVFRAHALNCYELHTVAGEHEWACTDCHSCKYFRDWSGSWRSE